MKSTTAKTLTRKIEAQVKAKHLNRNSVIFDSLMQVAQGVTELRPVTSSGRGNYRSLSDRTVELTSALKGLGVEFTLTNDAPRGGRTGALITITTKVR